MFSSMVGGGLVDLLLREPLLFSTMQEDTSAGQGHPGHPGEATTVNTKNCIVLKRDYMSDFNTRKCCGF